MSLKVKADHLSNERREEGFLQFIGKMLEGSMWANSSRFMVSREQAITLQQSAAKEIRLQHHGQHPPIWCLVDAECKAWIEASPFALLVGNV